MARIPEDLTIVRYTANRLSNYFFNNTNEQLIKAAQNQPIITVSQQPIEVENNIVVDLPYHHLSIYKQALIGAKAAQTRFIALAEDDVLYSPEHFHYRPNYGKFAYNMNTWNLTTWGQPMFTQKLGGRKNLGNLICSTELFIHAMEERFLRWTNDDDIDLRIWAEPSKYERQLDVSVQESEVFYTNPPNIMFSHETALSFSNLGMRKRLGEIRAIEIPYWGPARVIRNLYEKND